MNILSEQDQRVSRAILVALGVMAAAVVPVLAILLLQSCEPKPSRPSPDGQSRLMTRPAKHLLH